MIKQQVIHILEFLAHISGELSLLTKWKGTRFQIIPIIGPGLLSHRHRLIHITTTPGISQHPLARTWKHGKLRHLLRSRDINSTVLSIPRRQIGPVSLMPRRRTGLLKTSSPIKRSHRPNSAMSMTSLNYLFNLDCRFLQLTRIILW